MSKGRLTGLFIHSRPLKIQGADLSSLQSVVLRPRRPKHLQSALYHDRRPFNQCNRLRTPYTSAFCFNNIFSRTYSISQKNLPKNSFRSGSGSDPYPARFGKSDPDPDKK
jgi:hypothetical protein